MEKKIAQFLYQLNPFTLGLQLLGLVSSVLTFLFAAMFSGALDLLGYDFRGLSETCTILPFAFLITLITDVNYPRLKERRLAKWFLLISTMILNGILAIQVMALMYTMLRLLRSLAIHDGRHAAEQSVQWMVGSLRDVQGVFWL